MSISNLGKDNTYRLPAIIQIGQGETTFEGFKCDAQSAYRVRSWSIFGGDPLSAIYLYRYQGQFDRTRVLGDGEGLTAVIQGGSGYVNPIQELLRVNDGLAVILGTVAAGLVRVNVTLDYIPAGERM